MVERTNRRNEEKKHLEHFLNRIINEESKEEKKNPDERKGTSIVIFGQTGCGKSSLLNSIRVQCMPDQDVLKLEEEEYNLFVTSGDADSCTKNVHIEEVTIQVPERLRRDQISR